MYVVLFPKYIQLNLIQVDVANLRSLGWLRTLP